MRISVTEWAKAKKSLVLRWWHYLTPSVLFIVLALVAACRPITAPSPISLPASPLPWVESGGRFDTNDIARAQQEIPFQIVLPTYLPDSMPVRPDINGPLKQYQSEGQVEVDILYLLHFSNGTIGTLRLSESNYSVTAPDPKLNPGFQQTQISGHSVIETDGNFAEGPGTILYFTFDRLWFVVEAYKLPQGGAQKIVQSMLE